LQTQVFGHVYLDTKFF